MLTKRDLLRSAAVIAALRCGSAEAGPGDGAELSRHFRSQVYFAEEGFIYGLPIVMNYGIMYEYAVDRNWRRSRRRSTFDQEENPRRYVPGHAP